MSFEENRSIRIGRKSGNEIVLDDKKSSRNHAKISHSSTGWTLNDLDSGNGTQLNGRDINSQLLRANDEVQVGDAVILVVSTGEAPAVATSAILADDPAPAPEPRTEEPEEVVEKDPIPTEAKLNIKKKIDDRVRAIDEIKARANESTKLKILKKIGGIAVAGVVLVAAAVLIIALTKKVDDPNAVADTNKVEENVEETPASPEAERALAKLRSDVESVGAVTDEFLSSVEQLSRKFGREYKVGGVGANPFESIYNDLSMRREEKIGGIMNGLDREVRIIIEKGDYGEALSKLQSAKKANPEMSNDHLRALMIRINSEAETEYNSVSAFGERLEDQKRFDEAGAYYLRHARRFENTQWHALLVNKPATMSDLAAADRVKIKKAKEELKRKWENPTAGRSGGNTGEPGKQPSKPTLSPLTAKAMEMIQAGQLSSVKILGGTISGASDAGIGINKDGTKDVTAWSMIPAEALFTIYANMSLKGDDLLSVAEFGYVHGITGAADEMLQKYIGRDKDEKKAAADELLAKVRGESKPEEGYKWNRKLKTFESPAQIANRVAVAKIDSLTAKLAGASNVKSMDKAFDEILGYYQDPSLWEDTRTSIKTKTIAALKDNKAKRLANLAKKAKSGNIGSKLKPLKMELNKRREAAIKVIYDPKIYLPEDHPDWRKGDKINGQQEVDRLVDLVREIWERPGSFAMDASLKRDVEQVKAINDKYLSALGETSEGDDLADFQEVVNNLNASAALSIQSFSLNGKESEIYKWNRRVERYNAALKHPDVSNTDREHTKIVNEYREMMGRKRCFIDARLNRATKKHSQACDAAGRIWHVGSDGSPQSRAKAEGFSAGVGENVAIGYSNPRGTWWDGWYRASDHHRNGLSSNWNCMGYGFAGRVGTQNFANIGAPKGM